MAAAPPLDIRRYLDDMPMSFAQGAAVTMTVVLSAMDGYDVLSMTFAAPAISHAWGIGKGMLGMVLSSGLVGMALGSFILAPLADSVGRRKVVFTGLLLMAVGMLLAAFAHSIPQLAIARVITGLGVGACVAVINPLAAEFSNARRRSLALAAMAMGYPIGGVAGGLLSALLLKFYGWPAVFIAGCCGALVLLPLTAIFVPEPLVYLISRGTADRVDRINALLARFGHGPISAVSVPDAPPRRGYALIFAAPQRRTTAWIMSVNLLFVLAVYYVLSWLPQMVSDAGFPPSTASLVAAEANIVGVVGGLLLGVIARRTTLRWLTGGGLIGLGLSTVGFGLAPASLPFILLAAGLCGFFLYSGAAGMYATLATCFTGEARASGSGFVIGVGRITSAIAPSLAGWLFAAGFGRVGVCAIFGACSVLSGVVLFGGGKDTHERVI
jgi:MFS transporter, AAHS family, 4-hydroxybenzoate transporter